MKNRILGVTAALAAVLLPISACSGGDDGETAAVPTTEQVGTPATADASVTTEGGPDLTSDDVSTTTSDGDREQATTTESTSTTEFAARTDETALDGSTSTSSTVADDDDPATSTATTADEVSTTTSSEGASATSTADTSTTTELDPTTTEAETTTTAEETTTTTEAPTTTTTEAPTTTTTAAPTTTTAPPTTTTTRPPTTTTTTRPAPTTTAAPAPDPNADVSAVTASFSRLIDSNVPFSQKTALLDNASGLQGVHDSFVSFVDGYGSTGAQITSISITGNEADFKFDALVNGVVIQRDVTGQAVRRNGSWVITRASFCSAVSLVPGLAC